MLFGTTDLVGAGQKSGMFWAFKRKTGELAWSTQAAPGGVTGGLQWGSATDGRRIFVAAANSGPVRQRRRLGSGGLDAQGWHHHQIGRMGRARREERRRDLDHQGPERQPLGGGGERS